MRVLLRSLVIPLAIALAAPVPAAMIGGVFKGTANAVDTAGIFGSPGAALNDVDFKLYVFQNLSPFGGYRLHGPNFGSYAFLTLNGYTNYFSDFNSPSSGTPNASLVYNGIDGLTASGSSIDSAFSLSISGLSGVYDLPPFPESSGIAKLDGLVDPALRAGTFQFAGVSSGTLTISSFQTGGVPEPATWAMMIVGFGAIGAAIRPRRLTEAADPAAF